MNEISNINRVSFRSNSAENLTSNITNPIDNKVRNSYSDFYIDTKGAEAIKSNSNILQATDIIKAISADDYISKLNRAGMIEGKDYEIFTQANGGKSFYINDKNGECTKILFWDNGDKAANFAGYQNIAIKNNQSKVITEYDKNNILTRKSVWYENANSHKNLFPEGIDLETTPKDYISYLESQNKLYDVKEAGENGDKNTFIVEKDSEDNPLKMTSFLEYSDGSKFINQTNSPDKYGNFGHEISMVSDGNYCDITVTDNVKRLGIRG